MAEGTEVTSGSTRATQAVNLAFPFIIALILTLSVWLPGCRSYWSIRKRALLHHADDAPEAAKLAAREQRQSIQKSTGDECFHVIVPILIFKVALSGLGFTEHDDACHITASADCCIGSRKRKTHPSSA